MSEVIPVIIGIDGGSTKTAVRLEAVDGSWSVLAVYDKAGTNLHAYSNEQKAAFVGRRHLDKAIGLAMDTVTKKHGIQKPLQIVTTVIGTAGLDSPNDKDRFIQVFSGCELLKHLPEKALVVTSDVVIINSCGHSTSRLCLIAGTGSNCYAWRILNDSWVLQHYVGGLDLPLSDNGSAAWIGLKACQRALFLANTCFGGDSFATAIYNHLSINLLDAYPPEHWRLIKNAVGVMDNERKRDIAAICEQVVAPMAATGNTEALAILCQAGEDLADMAAGAIGYIEAATHVDEAVWSTESDAFDLLLVGGVWKNDLVFQTFMDGLAKRSIRNVRLPKSGNRVVDPTLGAIAMARALLK